MEAYGCLNTVNGGYLFFSVRSLLSLKAGRVRKKKEHIESCCLERISGYRLDFKAALFQMKHISFEVIQLEVDWAIQPSSSCLS